MAALLIGATGMLAGAARHFASEAGGAVMLARRASGFSFGDAALDTWRIGIDADWKDSAAFGAALDEAGRHGPFALALAWLHGRDEAMRERVTRLVAEGGTLVEVLGSAASRPGAFGDERLAAMRAHPGVRYRQVLLGFVVEDGGSRWLTHGEISKAAIAALAAEDTRTIAGQVEPWDARPR